jgi:hypothetical protein
MIRMFFRWTLYSTWTESRCGIFKVRSLEFPILEDVVS